MHKSFVINIIARLLLFSSGMMIFPLLWALSDKPHSSESYAFEGTILFGLFLGVLLIKIFPIDKSEIGRMNAKDMLSIVGLSWITLSAFGALPLYFSGAASSYTDSMFEIVSGFTTTGASVFFDIEALPRGILFWRSLTQWLGGMGIIVLYIALLPAIGASAYQLYKAEAPGVTVQRIEPRLKETAKLLWGVYFLLSLSQMVILRLTGLSWFDAICHTFTTMATGGFSTRNASAAAFSPLSQWVIFFFMFLAGISFNLLYQMFRGQSRLLWKNEEFKYYFLGQALLIPFFALILWGNSLAPAVALKDASFQIVSILTTTGFVTADFDQWPNILRFLLLFLMIVGGCGGSTGGGMKVIRLILLVKISWRSVFQSIFPNMVSPVRINGNPISESVVLSILTFFAIFVGLLMTGTALFVVFEGCDLVTAFSAVLSSLSNVGPGLNMVGPIQNFGWISDPGKWLLIFLMLAGRLELYAMLVLFLPVTWRK